MHLEKRNVVAAAVFGLLSFTACQKELSDGLLPEPAPADTVVAVVPGNRLNDTTLEYAKELYLWNEQLPADFDAQGYNDPGGIMTAIRKYSKEPGFADPVDRWSFAINQEEWNNVSSGIAADFGLGVFFRDENDLRVKLVEAASPAGKAGIRRGWRIVKINGNSNIATSNTDFVVDNVFASDRTTFTFQKPDGSTTDITLDAGTYLENPVVLDSVYSVGGKKIGYFVFNSFLGDTAKIYNAFNSVFSNFAAQGVRDVVVDLRYNGGGYVSVQQKLANYLVPASANGKRMMQEAFNNLNSRYNSVENFNKLGTLNPERISFIVSKSTASASELLINNLKPYIDVRLVGPSKTYGKPVGFFPIPVGSWYIFPVSFRSTNANNEGAYFGGMALNRQAADGLDKDWGDLKEAALANAINEIAAGALTGAPGPSYYREKPAVANGNEVLARPGFRGAIDVRGMR